jgi:hypothetical protein
VFAGDETVQTIQVPESEDEDDEGNISSLLAA